MDRSSFSEFGVFSRKCAASIVETQRIFDRDYVDSLETVLPAAHLLSGVLGVSGALSILPARLVAGHAEWTTQIALRRSRAFSFSLMVKPANLGFRISHETTEETESSIRLELEQIPSPAVSVAGAV
jgi:hypothetical protein